MKPAAPAVMAAGLYAGTTLADDGKPVLLLDPLGHAPSAGVRFARARSTSARACGGRPRLRARPPCSCSGPWTASAVRCRSPRSSGSRTFRSKPIQFSAGRLHVALGESLLPLEGCEAAPAEGKLRILRLTDGVSEIAYGFAEVIDIRAVALEVQPAPAPGEVARSGPGRRRAGRDCSTPIGCSRPMPMPRPMRASGRSAPCPTGDPWMENILRPLVESAGYRVVAARDGVAADIVIQSRRSRGGRGFGAHRFCASARSLTPTATTASTATTAPPCSARLTRNVKGRAMAELLLIVRLAGERVAFPAAEVESVVEIEGLTPVPRAAGHVAGLSALRSRVLTVIDCLASLEFGCSARAQPKRSSVVDGHPYALLVEEVEDVVEAAAPPAPIGSLGRRLGPGRARRWSRPRASCSCSSTRIS